MRFIFPLLFLSFVLGVPVDEQRKKCAAVYPSPPPNGSNATTTTVNAGTTTTTVVDTTKTPVTGTGKTTDTNPADAQPGTRTGTGTGIQGALAKVLGRQSRYIDTFTIKLQIFKFKSTTLNYENTTNEHIRDLVQRVQNIYSKNSYGQVKIEYDIYNDWITYNPAEAHGKTAERQSGIKQKYPNLHFVFIMNGQLGGGIAGLEGGRYLFLPETVNEFVFSHELGHSIGFSHSNVLGVKYDYADSISIMANGPDPEFPLFPAAYRQFAGWLADSAVVLIENRVSKSVTIHEIYSSSASDVIAIAYKPSDASKFYTRPNDQYERQSNVLYAEYYSRRIKGPKNTKILESKVYVRVTNAPMPKNDKDDGVSSGTTLLATLGEGESYTAANLDGITITAKNFNSETAVVDVSW
jgi:hypothetical protein